MQKLKLAIFGAIVAAFMCGCAASNANNEASVISPNLNVTKSGGINAIDITDFLIVYDDLKAIKNQCKSLGVAFAVEKGGKIDGAKKLKFIEVKTNAADDFKAAGLKALRNRATSLKADTLLVFYASFNEKPLVRGDFYKCK